MAARASRLGVVANRAAVGFVFAAAYQSVVGAATSLMSLPLAGDISDLLAGIERIDSGQGQLLVTWWVASTLIITAIAVALLRFKKYISPYRGEPDLDAPGRVTVQAAVAVGAVISALFFLLDSAVGLFYAGEQDVQAVYQAALAGDFEPLAVSALFSVAAGFIIVGVGSRMGRVKEMTAGLSGIAAGLRRGRAGTTVADTVGMRPGELFHVGRRKVDEVTFELFRYGERSYERLAQASAQDCLSAIGSEGTAWANVTGIHDARIVSMFGERAGLHRLVQADIMNTDLRPRVEVSDGYIFVILKMPHFDAGSGSLAVEQVSLVLGQGYVVSFQEVPEDVFGRIRDRLAEDGSEVRRMGSDYLTYLLVDALVDNYFAVLERIGERTERLEEELMDSPTPSTLETIYSLKRQLITLRRMIWPLREEIGAFERTPSPLVSQETRAYLRDVYNHTVQVMDTLESLRDMVGGMLDTYLSSVSNKMNEVMKTLTVIASIFIPITFIAGIYGTNFAYIPELGWRGGYFAMLAVMGGLAGVMLAWFRRRRWI